MVDKDRISKAIADLEATRVDMEQLVSSDWSAFRQDRRNLLSLRYLLIQAVEAMCDICQHALAILKGLACDGYVDCVQKAGENGIFSNRLLPALRELAELRNLLIHRYWVIDDQRVFSETKANLPTLQAFCQEIEERFL